MSTLGKRKDAPTGQCLTLLKAFCDKSWRPCAWQLNRLGMLDERARISDLRHRWGIPVRADIIRDRGYISTTYVIPEEYQEEAKRLISRGMELEREEREAQQKERK